MFSLLATPAVVVVLALATLQSPHKLLDVPYVAQTPELCGGAAVAMVMRFWGERQVFPEDFQSLVVPAERGIPTRSLVDAARQRRWQAVELGRDASNAFARIRSALDRGQPLIALIEVGPRTYHYVVLVAATEKEIVLHDPARSPFRVVPWAEFDRVWTAAGSWMLLLLPPATVEARTEPTPTVTTPASPSTPCDALVDRGVSLALGDDKVLAEDALMGASRVCPFHAAAWRELAGWRFKQSRWAEAVRFAETAVRLAPDDSHARELLATSRYLSGDLEGALAAWAPSGEPRIDSVNVHGASRTRHPVVVAATGLKPRQVLTPEAFAFALRRVQSLPVAAGARVHYEPLDGGLARVDVSLSERDRFPSGWIALGILAGRAAISNEVKADIAGVFGAAERISVSGRWREERPRVMFGLSAPSPSWLPGVSSFDVLWERQTYPDIRQSRRRVSLQTADWAASWLRWRAGLALDRFDSRRHVAAEAELDLRLLRDRVAVVVTGSRWFKSSDSEGFASAVWLAAWRSSTSTQRINVSALAEAHLTTRASPLAVWPGAGTNSARAGLLRAHPLLKDDVLSGPVFGRRMARGTIEVSTPVTRAAFGNLSIAAFVDGARAWHRRAGGPSPFFIDAGLGLRVFAPGRSDGVRIDLAKGLRGGDATLSAGWLAAWPR
jgi:hypothetical protein